MILQWKEEIDNLQWEEEIDKKTKNFTKTIETLGKNAKYSVTAQFERKELSGQNSSTKTASAGNKPKKISASLQIPTDKPENLTFLLSLAEALDEKGSPIVYSISDSLCKAMKIRQVIFIGSVKADEDGTLQVYNVSFSFQESNSVAEKREEREKSKAKPETPAAEGEVAVGSTNYEKVVKASKI